MATTSEAVDTLPRCPDHCRTPVTEEIFSMIGQIWLCWIILKMFFKMLIRRLDAAIPPLAPTIQIIKVLRCPARGNPSIVSLETTTKLVVQAPDCFPGYIPNAFKFWIMPGELAFRRDWEVVQLRPPGWTNHEGLYLIVYSFSDEHMPENHNVPKMLQPFSRTFGDLIVARLESSQCGKHGWAVYKDVRPGFLHIPWMKDIGKSGSRL